MIFKFGRDCENCETLRELLEAERATSAKLLDALLKKSSPPEPIMQAEKEEIKPIMPHIRPFRMIRETLEAESRAAAQKLKDREKELQSQPIEKLEEQVGIKNA